jgi:hypothetical protein
MMDFTTELLALFGALIAVSASLIGIKKSSGRFAEEPINFSADPRYAVRRPSSDKGFE